MAFGPARRSRRRRVELRGNLLVHLDQRRSPRTDGRADRGHKARRVHLSPWPSLRAHGWAIIGPRDRNGRSRPWRSPPSSPMRPSSCPIFPMRQAWPVPITGISCPSSSRDTSGSKTTGRSPCPGSRPRSAAAFHTIPTCRACMSRCPSI